jgi:hypothetical protein
MKELVPTSQSGGFGTAAFVFVDNSDCCTDKNQHLRVPDAETPEGYTVEVCTTILETIDQVCSTSVPIATPAPSHQPTTTVSRSPSVSPSVPPSAAPSFKATVQIVESTPPTQGQAPDPPLSQEGEDKEEDVITNDDDNIGDDDDNFRIILIASVAAAGGVVLIAIMILSICICRRLRAQHHFPKIPKEVFTKGSKYSGRSVTVGDQDEDSDQSRTEFTEGDEYDDDHDIDYGFDLEHGLHDDEDDAITLFTDDDYLALMRNPDNNVGDDSEASDDDKIKNKTVGPLTRKEGNDDDCDGMSRDDGSDGDTLTSLVSADGLSQGDEYDKNKTVGPLTWKQGYDGDDDGMSTDDDSDGDTLMGLLSVSDMSQGDDRDSVAESIEQSFTSVDIKGSSLSSREIAIYTIIEQSKNGAEWFEFNLASDDEDDDDDDDVSDDEDNDLFTIDNLGFDPADAAALRAIASGHSHLSLR